jgi:hypothetical protein
MTTTVSALEDHATLRSRHPLLTLAAAVLLFAVLLLLIGAQSPQPAHESPAGAGSVARTEASDSSPRTASERAWNEQEDLKAARYVGQPGIY